MSAIDFRPLVSRPMEDLAADRDAFLATGVVAGSVRPVVRESWRRCVAWGVSPGELRRQEPRATELESARRRSAALLAAAAPWIDSVHETLAGHPHLVVLADADGVVLRLRAGPGFGEESLRGSNLVEGASWHERDIGCNGVGTALATGEPVILIGPEHFQEAYTGWTCIGVPLRAADGSMAGALDLSVPNGHVNVHTWGWTLAVGRSIEARLRGEPGARDGVTVSDPDRVPALEDPFHAIRGVIDLLAQQLELAPTHARFIDDARREVDRAESQLAVAVRELMDREERLRLVVENSPDSTFIQDRELRYVWGASRAGPFTAADYIGRTDSDLFDDPDEARMVTDIKRRVLREGRRTTVDMTATLRGRRRRLHATFEAARQPDGTVVGLFGYVRDVTGEWHMREALRDSHSRLRAVLEILPAGVWITDETGRIIETNAAAADLWGGRAPLSQRPEDYGLDYPAWRHDGHRLEWHEWPLAMAVRDGAVTTAEELVIGCADGTRRTVLYFAAPIRQDPGVISGAVALAIDITDRKDAERHLSMSEERFRKLAEASTLGLFISDESGVIHYANRTVRRLLGFSATDVSAGRLRQSMLTPPEAAGANLRAAAELEASGACTPYETTLVARDGSRVPVLVGASLLELHGQERPAVATFVTDLTPLRTAQRALTESEAQFRTLANSIPQLAWMADPQGSVFWYNDRWYEYTGTTLAQVSGDGWKRAHHPDHVERVADGLYDSFRRGEPWEDTFPLRSASGEYRWFLSRAMPVRDPAGSIVRWIGTNTDITERRQAQAELQRLYEEAQEAVRQREEVVGVVGHDLRNPLSTLSMASALILDPHVPAERKAIQAAVIRRAVEQMMRLIQDLLDVSRMGASRFSIDLRPEDAAALVRTAAQLATNAAESRHIALTVDAPSALPWIRADRQRILQVFGNLLANALEFTPEGGRVTLGARAAPGAVEFTVTDTGPGIAIDDQPHVFDRFWQGGGRAGHGAGLGLTICRGIVEAHGGSITVHSEPGRGATFRFTIPSAPTSRA